MHLYGVYRVRGRGLSILDGVLFTIGKAQLHVSALNVGRLEVVQ